MNHYQGHKKTAVKKYSGLYIKIKYNLLFLGYELYVDVKFIENGFVSQVIKKRS